MEKKELSAEIIQFPNKILSKSCNNVRETGFNKELLKIVNHMQIVLHKTSNGIGLSANQIGISKRIVVFKRININNNTALMDYIINPEIVIRSKTKLLSKETCLSCKDYENTIERYRYIKVKGKTFDNKVRFIDTFANKLLSVTLQHEIDHINGITIKDK